MDDFGNIVHATQNSSELIWKMIYFFYGAIRGVDSHVIASDNPI